MTVKCLAIPEVLLFEPDVYPDSRGYFFEAFRASRYAEYGLPVDSFSQDSVSFSNHGVIRGLHFQNPNSQGKLIHVLSGEVFDVAVDVRQDSPTFGKWVGEYLSDQNHRQLWIPPGFAHGFCATGEHALVTYKLSGPYAPACEKTLRWDDPTIGIEWPIDDPILSAKDLAGQALESLLSSGALRFEGDFS